VIRGWIHSCKKGRRRKSKWRPVIIVASVVRLGQKECGGCRARKCYFI
jgi:hypothetical protein